MQIDFIRQNRSRLLTMGVAMAFGVISSGPVQPLPVMAASSSFMQVAPVPEYAPTANSQPSLPQQIPHYRLSAEDPNQQSNPTGSGFPGFRGGQQLVLYTPRYGQPTTGTNEYGYEVTVQNGRVVAQEGANSNIPLTGDSSNTFVLSGHGKARDWLVANTPIGASVTRLGDYILSETNPDTYLFQLEHRLNEVRFRLPSATLIKTQQQLVDLRQRLTGQILTTEAAKQQTQQTMADLNKAVWSQMPKFTPTAIKGAWHRPVELTEAAIATRLDQLKQSGINTVFLETFYHGYTIFPSQTYVAYGLPTPYPKFAPVGFDPLDVWTRLAHKRGMQVHVWFQTFYGGTKAFQSPGPILSRYPHWANRQYVALGVPGPVASNVETGHYFLDPANPEVTSFLQKLLVEIATRYPVDGIQLDYIRYGSSFPLHRYSYLKTTWGYTEVARQAFMQATGVDPANLNPTENPDLWQQWMQQKNTWVSQFVQSASTAIRKARPGVKISAAVFPGLEDALIKKHQDWGTWAKQGWVDFLAPMTLTSASKIVYSDVRRMVELTDGTTPVVAGVFGAFNGNSADILLEQVYQAKQAGATGVCVFDTAHLTAEQRQALLLGLGKPLEEATTPRPGTGKMPSTKLMPSNRHKFRFIR
jgi:uncharacterized lipoprotein YddW (UPF0748 family)